MIIVIYCHLFSTVDYLIAVFYTGGYKEGIRGLEPLLLFDNYYNDFEWVILMEPPTLFIGLTSFRTPLSNMIGSAPVT